MWTARPRRDHQDDRSHSNEATPRFTTPVLTVYESVYRGYGRSKKTWGSLETPELNFTLPKYGKVKVPSLRLPGVGQPDEADVFVRLGTILESMEAMIEDMNCLRAYRTEIQAVSDLGCEFS